MSGCCDPRRYDEIFGARFARRVARRYRRRGLDRSSRRLVALLLDRGIDGASVLEIGGGVGEIQVELLRRGAASSTNLELATGYEAEAAALLEDYGLADRATRLQVNIAEAPERVQAADVVVLHRVVCCYPDYERLLAAAADHARRLLVYSHPPRTRLTRSLLWVQNHALGLTGRSFRAYVHPPKAMEAVLGERGLDPRHHRRGLVWQVVGAER